MIKKMLLGFDHFFIIFGVIICLLGSGAKCSASEEDYKIGAEDVLHLSVWGNDQLNKQVIVRPDGKLSFPLVDDIQVSGLTCLEVKKIIEKKIIAFVTNPQVTVIVENINNYKVYVIGSAGAPGVLNLKRKTTLLQLLAMVGGPNLAEEADLEGAYVLRGTERLLVDFERLIEKGDITQNIELLPDDVVYIPDNFDKRITVVGEVAKPGIVTFRKNITLLDAVLMSGGITEDADAADTKIIRKTAQKEEIIKVNLKEVIKKGKVKDNVDLRPRDLIVVPARVF